VPDEAQAREAQRQLESILERLGLRLNPKKTRLVQLAEGREGFDFLGLSPPQASVVAVAGSQVLAVLAFSESYADDPTPDQGDSDATISGKRR